MKQVCVIGAALLALSACSSEPPAKDYDAMRQCAAMGKAAGTPEYNRCVREEQSYKLMQQQRDDFERVQQQQMDWRNQGMPRY